MRFEGNELELILACQTEPVEVRNAFGRVEVRYQNPLATFSVLRRGHYYGVGHKKRIRFIQAESVYDRVVPWGAELDFAGPTGAEAHLISVGPGRPRRRVVGAKTFRMVMPSRLTRPQFVTTENPIDDASSLRNFGAVQSGGVIPSQDSAIYREYGSRAGEWEVVCRIREMRKSGLKCAQVAQALNGYGIPTRITGQPWSRGMVVAILRRRGY